MSIGSEDDEDEVAYFNDEGGELEGAPAAIAAAIDAGGDWDALDVELCALPQNDLANAKRMDRRFPSEIHWTKEWGPGVWDGARFDFDHGDSMAGQMAQATAIALLELEVPAFYGNMRRRGEEQKSWDKRAGQFYTFALTTGNNGKTEGLLKQHERMNSRPLADFDRDPDRLVLANGTLDLPQDGSAPRFVAAFDPAHLVTKQARANWDPKARCPQFEAFLEKVQPDPAMRAFLARVIGYCLTGRVSEQAYFIFHGKGGDGKSTFLNALERVLGGYVANAAIESFLKRDKKGSDHSADLARLASGVRLVKASEPEQGAVMAESVIKVVTGGEPMPARAMYRPMFEFIPDWKLIISCNRKPRITGGDRGIWRRTVVVPWPVSIPKEDMDQHLGDKLALEADGVLNWAVAGWADWLEKGLDPPKAVLEAVEEYRLASDPFAAWFANCCDVVDGSMERASKLYESYRGWVDATGFDPMKQTSFGRQLGENNLTRRRSNGICWEGVRLNAAGQEALESYEATRIDSNPFGHD